MINNIISLNLIFLTNSFSNIQKNEIRMNAIENVLNPKKNIKKLLILLLLINKQKPSNNPSDPGSKNDA